MQSLEFHGSNFVSSVKSLSWTNGRGFCKNHSVMIYQIFEFEISSNACFDLLTRFSKPDILCCSNQGILLVLPQVFVGGNLEVEADVAEFHEASEGVGERLNKN